MKHYTIIDTDKSFGVVAIPYGRAIILGVALGVYLYRKGFNKGFQIANREIPQHEQTI